MKASIQQSFKSAFPKTIPIIPGYIFLGIAFGILLTDQGYAWYWPLIMAVVIFSGMAQFVTVNMLAPGISLINTFIFMLTLNARHVFYGLSLLEKFKAMGKLRPDMIYSLSDERPLPALLGKAAGGSFGKIFLLFHCPARPKLLVFRLPSRGVSRLHDHL